VNPGGGSGTATAGSVVSFDGQSDNPVLANYYSFNNNYLNDTNILRALNFENQSLINNNIGRIGQSLQYLSDLTGTVSQNQAVIGARENEISQESNFQTTSSTNTQVSLSNAQDTDIAKVSSDLAQRQAALQALRTITATVLGQTLFDFVKL
jgi:flagellin-like hook-associated protein FlgL